MSDDPSNENDELTRRMRGAAERASELALSLPTRSSALYAKRRVKIRRLRAASAIFAVAIAALLVAVVIQVQAPPRSSAISHQKPSLKQQPPSTKVGKRSSRNRQTGGISEDPLTVASNDAIAFPDSEVGFLLAEPESAFSVVDKTTDGGATWTTAFTAPSPNLRGLEFVNDTDGWVVGSSTIYRTRDGGQTWSPLTETSPNLASIDFVSATTGWGLTNSGTLYASSDGGESWTEVDTNGPSFAACLVDVSDGWILNGQGIEATSNGGDSWTNQYTPSFLINSGPNAPTLSCNAGGGVASINTGGGMGTFSYIIVDGVGSPSDASWSSVASYDSAVLGQNVPENGLHYEGTIENIVPTSQGGMIALSICGFSCDVSASGFISGTNDISSQSYWESSLTSNSYPVEAAGVSLLNSGKAWVFMIAHEANGGNDDYVFDSSDGGQSWSLQWSNPIGGSS